MVSEMRKLLEAWTSARAAAEEVALATVVRVHGSSYRKPGARMLVTRSGRRIGMVSGGCLESDVTRKIWWLTEHGPAVKQYNTSFDEDGNASYGLGCGGSVELLLERGNAAAAIFEAVRSSIEERCVSRAATVLVSHHPEIAVGARVFIPEQQTSAHLQQGTHRGADLLRSVPRDRIPAEQGVHTIALAGGEVEVFVEHFTPPLALRVFGAGDDAQPVVELASALGWEVTVADGRAHLVTPDRFPLASARFVLSQGGRLDDLRIHSADAAVILTHSFQQDLDLLRTLLPMDLFYLGMLGPRHRTRQLLDRVAPLVGLSVEECLARLHAPVGLNIGADSPLGVALSIVTEIYAADHARTAAATRDLPLPLSAHA